MWKRGPFGTVFETQRYSPTFLATAFVYVKYDSVVLAFDLNGSRVIHGFPTFTIWLSLRRGTFGDLSSPS